MARILITSGPTRQYLDPVRYLSNGSSGRMGRALAEAAVAAGHETVVVTGPVEVTYPPQAEVIRIVSTEELLEACLGVFPSCDGLIAAAAPCDYRPDKIAKQKISKSGESLTIRFAETPDVVASLAKQKESRWIVAFALETQSPRPRALEKLRRKQCDLIVVNGPEVIGSDKINLEVIAPSGNVLAVIGGEKGQAAQELLGVISHHLVG